MGASIRKGGKRGRRERPASALVHPRTRMRAAGALALLAAIAWSSCAVAHPALYQCKGTQGETVFTSHADQYKGCKLISGASAPSHRESALPVIVKASAAQPMQTVAQTPAQFGAEAKADPAIITVTPLASAPVARSLPSPNITKLPIGKPWPMALLDAIATDLLPRVLDPRAAVGNASSSLSPTTANASTVVSQIATTSITENPSVASAPKRGAVYKITRKDGSVEYTNIATRAQGADATMLFTYIITCYACNVHSRVDFNTVALHLNDYGDEIRTAAVQSGVSEALLRAVIHAESAFNPRALSYKGAQGLMQLMPGTANDLGVTNAFDVSQNIRGGAKYLAQLLHDFNGNVQWAAAAYNAGEAAVRKYNGVPPYDETQVYVKRVAILRDRYLKALHPAALAAAGAQ